MVRATRLASFQQSSTNQPFIKEQIMDTKTIEQKIGRYKGLKRDLDKIQKMSIRLYEGLKSNKYQARGELTIFDRDGNNPVNVNCGEFLHYPEHLIEILELREVEIKKELNELEEVFSVTERLLK